jgi:hypothetical protein
MKNNILHLILKKNHIKGKSGEPIYNNIIDMFVHQKQSRM